MGNQNNSNKKTMGNLVLYHSSHRGTGNPTTLRLAEIFANADKDRSGLISLSELKSSLKKLGVKVNDNELKRIFDQLDQDKSGSISFDEFVNLFHAIEKRPELQSLYRNYCSTDTMTWDDYSRFAREEQGERDISWARTLLPEVQKLDLLAFGFLLSQNDNSWVFPRESSIWQDMARPISHYWIFSSHNTYLTGDQWTSTSDVAMYSKFFLQGCRCVEIDCWDGKDGEPEVYHGHTLTSKIRFRDVIQTTYNTAFKNSPYPIMLSVELHCGMEQQKKMVDIMKSICGEQLLMQNTSVSVSDKRNYSPDGLGNKVIIKCKVGSKIHPDLVNSTWMISFKAADINEHLAKVKPYNVTSIEEQDTLELYKSDKDKLLRLNTICFNRVYPSVMRMDSSNPNVLPLFATGCQLLALNLQSNDLPCRHNRAFFRVNGNCGYVLKPPHLLGLPSPALGPMTLVVNILSARCLPSTRDKNDIPDPYVEVSLYGHEDPPQESRTKYITDNGYNPAWQEEFKFKVTDPYVSILTLQVYDYDLTYNELLAEAHAMVASMRNGYRMVQLCDVEGKPIEDCYLLIKTLLLDSVGRTIDTKALWNYATPLEQSNKQVVPKSESLTKIHNIKHNDKKRESVTELIKSVVQTGVAAPNNNINNNNKIEKDVDDDLPAPIALDSNLEPEDDTTIDVNDDYENTNTYDFDDHRAMTDTEVERRRHTSNIYENRTQPKVTTNTLRSISAIQFPVSKDDRSLINEFDRQRSIDFHSRKASSELFEKPITRPSSRSMSNIQSLSNSVRHDPHSETSKSFISHAARNRSQTHYIPRNLYSPEIPERTGSPSRPRASTHYHNTGPSQHLEPTTTLYSPTRGVSYSVPTSPLKSYHIEGWHQHNSPERFRLPQSASYSTPSSPNRVSSRSVSPHIFNEPNIPPRSISPVIQRIDNVRVTRNIPRRDMRPPMQYVDSRYRTHYTSPYSEGSHYRSTSHSNWTMDSSPVRSLSPIQQSYYYSR